MVFAFCDEQVEVETDDAVTYSTLKVTDVSGKNKGHFKIMAENKVGKSEASFKVNIKGTWIINQRVKYMGCRATS